MIRRKPLTDEQALLKMMDLCARSEQSTGEIRLKLIRKGISGPWADAIIGRLVADRFVDNARFARAFTADKVRFALWGRRKIRMALAAKGIEAAAISAALAGIDEDEYAEALMKAARGKARGVDMADYEERVRLYRSLASRGYEPEAIARVIARLKTEASGR